MRKHFIACRFPIKKMPLHVDTNSIEAHLNSNPKQYRSQIL